MATGGRLTVAQAVAMSVSALATATAMDSRGDRIAVVAPAFVSKAEIKVALGVIARFGNFIFQVVSRVGLVHRQ